MVTRIVFLSEMNFAPYWLLVPNMKAPAWMYTITGRDCLLARFAALFEKKLLNGKSQLYTFTYGRSVNIQVQAIFVSLYFCVIHGVHPVIES